MKTHPRFVRALALQHRLAAGLLLGLLASVNASAEESMKPIRNPFAHPKNLKVLDRNISAADLRAKMIEFSLGLDVRCTHCHAGTEADPIETLDFASDGKPPKQDARQMLRMLDAINGKFLPRIAKSEQPPIKVQCVTCHRGQERPEMIRSVLARELDTHGTEAAIARYRQLRARYYGGHTFDFTEAPLLALANDLANGGHGDQALPWWSLTLEFNPRSTGALSSRAQYFANHERRAEAKADLEAALAIDPKAWNAAQLRARLEAL